MDDVFDVKPEKKKRGRPKPAFKEAREDINARKQASRLNRARSRQREDGIGFLAEQMALLPGGFKDFVPFIRAAAIRETRFQPALEAYDKIAGYAQQTGGVFRFEEICRNLGIPLGELIGIATGIAYDQKKDMTRYISALAMPSVMKANIKQAKKPEGIEDRRMFMQSTGLLPVPKGSTINVSASSQAASMTVNGEPTGLPSFEDSTVTFSEVIRNATEVKTIPASMGDEDEA